MDTLATNGSGKGLRDASKWLLSVTPAVGHCSSISEMGKWRFREERTENQSWLLATLTARLAHRLLELFGKQWLSHMLCHQFSFQSLEPALRPVGRNQHV